MSLDHYNRLRVVGKGSYGEVWLVKHKGDKKQYVLKKMDLRKASKRERQAAEQEAKLLAGLKHPNIVGYKESFEAEDGFLYIAMGYCEGGDLYSRLKEQKGELLDERQIVEWFVQIAMALQYMHERNIMHRDLKTQNIFLTKSKVIKVGDLGIARVLDNASDMATTMIGTPYYMSPEIFANKPYNFKSDVWALGCCVYEMATLKHAFNGKDMNSLMYKILRGKMPPMPSKYREQLVNLIKAMLNKSPEKRPTINRLLRDPYIKENIALFLEGTRPSSAGPRRPSTGSGSRERPASSSAKKVPEAPVKTKPPAEPLEPLNIGPDLEPIREEPTPRPSDSVDSGIVVGVGQQGGVRVSSSSSSVADGYHTPSRSPVSKQPAEVQVQAMRKNPKQPIADIASNSPPRRSAQLPSVCSEPNLRSKAKSDVRRSENRNSPIPDDGGYQRKLPEKRNPLSGGGEENGVNLKDDNRVYENLSRAVASPRVLPPRPSVAGDPKLSHIHKANSAAYREESSHSSSSVERRQNKIASSSSSSQSDVDSSARQKQSVSLSNDGSDSAVRKSSAARQRRREKVSSSADMSSPLRDGSKLPPSVVSKSHINVDRSAADVSYLAPSSGSKSSYHSDITRSHSNPVLSNRPLPVAAVPYSNAAAAAAAELEEIAARNSDEEKKSNEADMDKLIELLSTTLQIPKKKKQSKVVTDNNDVVQPTSSSSSNAVKKMNLNATYVVSSVSVPSTPSLPQIDEYEVPVSAFDPGPDAIGIEPEVVAQNASEIPGISITAGGRLWERISFLHRDCVRAIGVEKLNAAFAIIDRISYEEVQPKLIELLGYGDFEEYAGKIFQLKFYMDTAFGGTQMPFSGLNVDMNCG